GLAETLAPPVAPVDQPGEEALLDLLGAVVHETLDQVAEAGPRRGPGPGQLLVEDDVVHRGQFVAADGAGPGKPEEAGVVERLVPGGLAGPVLVGGRGGGQTWIVVGQPLPQAGAEGRLFRRITE